MLGPPSDVCRSETRGTEVERAKFCALDGSMDAAASGLLLTVGNELCGIGSLSAGMASSPELSSSRSPVIGLTSVHARARARTRAVTQTGAAMGAQRLPGRMSRTQAR